MRTATLLLVAALLLVACQNPSTGPTPADVPDVPEAAPASDDVTNVRFETTAGDFVVAVHAAWAPLGAKRFLTLVEEGYYDGAGFYRVAPGFVVQFGIAADPAVTAKWADKRLKDDPVKQTNRRGTITFATAGPNTRTTDVFINYHQNGNLDRQGFAPFGEVVSGMERVYRISSAHGQQPDQRELRRLGNAYLVKNFPKLDYIKKARILPPEAKK